MRSSEATFYGYDGDDIAAAQVIAPEVLSATREADGVHLAWTHGRGIGALAVERRVGDGAWSEVATPSTSAIAATDSAEGLVSGTVYAYRVRATNEEKVRYSPEVTVLWYAAGGGTGLLATYSSPSPLASCDPDEAVLGSETVAGVNVVKASGESVYGGVADNVLVAWKGKLVVPVAGDYAFTAEATDGFMLELDGDVYIVSERLNNVTPQDTSICSVLNDWKSTGGAVTTRTRTGYSLTAGEHQIRAWWNPSTGAKSCVLKWTLPGTSVSEVIPSTQFVPAAAADPETYGADGWRFRSVSNTRGYIAQTGGDSFAIAEADVSPASPFAHGSYAWKKMSSDAFVMEANVYATQMFNEYGCIFVSANLNGGMSGDGASLVLYRNARRDGVNAFRRVAAGGAIEKFLAEDILVSAPGATTEQQKNNTDWQWLRIERDGNRFVLKARHGNSASPDGANGNWIEIATYVDSTGQFGKDVYIGFGSTTAALDPSLVYQARYLFSHVKAKERGGFVLVVW